MKNILPGGKKPQQNNQTPAVQQELDFNDLVGPFQLRIFCDSMKSEQSFTALSLVRFIGQENRRLLKVGRDL